MDEPQQPRVFLSYARADRPRVAKIAAALAAAGLSLWWDTAIEGGSSFAADIARELDAADVVVVFWSAISVASAWVLDEAGAGRDRKRLVPVQLDATPPPLGFRQLQAVDLSGWRGRASDPRLAALVAAIAHVAGSTPVAAKAPSPRPGSMLRLAPWLAAAVLLVALVGAAWYFIAPRFSATARPIIAVLPFTDMSEAKGKAYFAEGLAEEILDTLAHDPRLKVLGGTTARAIRDNSANPDFARDKLGVTRLLEGSVRGGGAVNSVKVSVRLIDTADGSEIWSQAFDRSGADVVAVQEEVARAVAAQLAGPLSGGAVPVPGAPSARIPPAAYEKVLVARQLLRTRQPVSLMQARTLGGEAIALAPDYAPAYAVRAHATALATLYQAVPISELPAARREAETAIRLDPNLSESHASLGFVLSQLSNTDAAIVELRRAVALKPDNSEAGYWLGRTLLLSWRTNQAIAALEPAVASDPLWRKPVEYLVQAYVQAGRFTQARALARHYRQMTPDPGDADFIDSAVVAGTGDFARALALAGSALVHSPGMNNALEAQANALTSMFATDRVSAAMWAGAPTLMQSATTGRWQAVADKLQASGAAAWDDPEKIAALSYALVQLGRSHDLVRAFDARFGSVAAYLASPAADRVGALMLAAAFDRAGRPDDARSLRNFVRAKLTATEADGTELSMVANGWAVLRLAEGDRAGALAKLEAGVGAGWWNVCGYGTWIGDDWQYAALHGDARFEAVKNRCRAAIDKQRRLAGFGPAVLN